MQRFLGGILGLGGLVALAACAGTRGASFTPEELRAMPAFGEGNCRAVVQNVTGRRVEAFYQTGLEERKVRIPMELWPLIGYVDIGDAVLLRAPCEERQIVVGWRQDIGQGRVGAGPYGYRRETLLRDGIVAVRMR